MAPDRRTFLSAGFGITAAVASRTNGLMTAARAHPGSLPPISGDLSYASLMRCSSVRV